MDGIDDLLKTQLPTQGDPKELIAELLSKGPQVWKGDSSENYNPTMKPALPPEYQPETRPYRGSEIPEDQFPPAKHDPFEAAAAQQQNEETIRNLPPRARALFDSFREETGKAWPETDNEYDRAFGPGATERSMSGEPLYPGGMWPYGKKRQQNMPPMDRFQDLRE